MKLKDRNFNEANDIEKFVSYVLMYVTILKLPKFFVNLAECPYDVWEKVKQM